jgi:hypothetical protein
MPDNPNTENLPLDSEDWELALAPYDDNPGAALMLAFHLTVLKAYLDIEPLKIQEAVEGLDRGIEILFRYTGFHTVIATPSTLSSQIYVLPTSK